MQCTKPSGESCLNPYSTGNEVVGGLIISSLISDLKSGLNPYSTGNEVVGVV